MIWSGGLDADELRVYHRIMRNYLFEVIRAFVESGVDFVVCGGVACVLQGCERTTFDIDIYARLSPANLDRVIAAARELGLTPRIPEPIGDLKDEERRRVWIEEKNALVYTLIDEEGFVQVDLLVSYPIEYSRLESNADVFEIEGAQFLVSSKRDLLEVKRTVQPPREKDLQDIRALQELIDE